MRSSRDERLSGHDAKGLFRARSHTAFRKVRGATAALLFSLAVSVSLSFLSSFFLPVMKSIAHPSLPFLWLLMYSPAVFFLLVFYGYEIYYSSVFLSSHPFFLRLRIVRPFLWPITNDSESRSYTKRGHRECLCRSFSRRAPSDRTTGDSDSAGDIDDLVKSTHSARNQTLMINFI